MYTKTQWVDNTTPIDKDNLNKIEQGIYDNSLVVDAVTNTINPTDTETYKTAELTEGQITDVIGVSDIAIKGQTSQDGTPTPSAPVDINVVSGSNVINTSNKNLLSLPNGTYSYNNVTAIVNKGIITINGTPSSTPTLLRISLTQPIKLKQNDSIKINGNNSNGIGTNSNYVAFRLSGTVNGVSNDNITDILCTNANANKTFTATNDTIINQAIIRGNTNVTFNNFIIKPQIELGTTTTTYELHQGKELPLDLPVENLFDEQLELGTLTNGTGVPAASTKAMRTVNFIKVNPNTTYTLSNDKNYTPYVFEYDSSETYIRNSTTQITPYTFTTGANTRYVKFRTLEGKTENDLSVKFMFEKNIKVTPYVPYGTDPIELCKIGDYQDYFYKSGSKWYLHKEMKKIKLDGSENWSTRSAGVGQLYETTVSGFFSTTGLSLGLSNQYASNINLTENNTFRIIYGNTLAIHNDTISGLDNFKNALSLSNLIIYYPLATATDTEITDTTLISQLEAIYNAPLYEETNITQTNNDLPMVLDITACKDNINGIKAFIRK